MSDKHDEAMNYVIGTNELENIKLSKEELENILKEIQKGRKDSSFLYELVSRINRRKEEILEEEHGRTI